MHFLATIVRPWHRTTEPSNLINPVRMPPKSVAIAAHTQDSRSYRNKIRCMEHGLEIHWRPMFISLGKIHSYINWYPTTIPNTSWPPQVASSLYFLLLATFTMRFIQFVIAGATLTLFNVYTYAKPVPVSEHAWCDGYSDLTCSIHCALETFYHSSCATGYVQMPSYKFDLTLKCKLQLLCLHVGYSIRLSQLPADVLTNENS